MLQHQGGATDAYVKSFDMRGGVVPMTLPQFILAERGLRSRKDLAAMALRARHESVFRADGHG